MRDLDAAEPDPVAGREGVHVEPLADADVVAGGVSRASASARSSHRRHLEIVGFAVEHMDGMARGLGDRGVVGEIGARGAPVRLEDEIEAEGLRRLHGAQGARGRAKRRSGRRRRPA